MTSAELSEFAGQLGRHIATVLANEHGYVAIVCAECRTPAGRRRGAETAATDPPECPTCGGMRRLWSKRRDGVVRCLSDRELIDTFAKRT